MERPQGPYETLFAEKNIRFSRENGVLRVEGRLTSGTYELPGDVSSQFITGLMYALPMLEGDSEIRLTTPLESSGYVDMTIDALSSFGVRIKPIEGGWRIPGGQCGRARDAGGGERLLAGGVYFAARLLGSDVEILGLNPNSAQGDAVIVPYAEQLARSGTVTLDVSQCPDLVPPLAVMAALRRGETTHIVGAARLRIKESDRLATVTAQLNALGAKIEELPMH